MASTAAAKGAPLQEQPASQEQKPPRPYSAWWNPNLSWLDLFICWTASFFIPLGSIALCPTPEKAKKRCDDIRIKFDKSVESGFHQNCRKWSKACGGLVQCTWRVPRRPEILYEWVIIDKDDVLMKQVMEKESNEEEKFVTVHMWCPASLVLKEGDDRKENDYGCVEVDNVELKNIPKEVPVVLWFHGGGLTLGTCDDAGWGTKIDAILEKQKKISGGESVPPIVLASVDYRLAPDHPLPAASIDSLSALDYCLTNDPERRIHVGGESAGAYLSLVSTFAGHKHDPGRLQSAFVMIPFISPAADSMSYFMNSFSSPLVTIPWARWCWRAALEMDDIAPVHEDDVVAAGSNRTAWNKSKWKQNEQWHKFMEPMAGIPPGLDNKENGIKFIVSVNKADPLYDEGNELMRKLKDAGADVEYLEAMGSHSIGFAVDRKAMEELMEVWRAAIFGD